MRLDLLLLADAATPSEGKVNLLGAGLTRITVPEVPCALSQLVVAVRFALDESDLNTHQKVTLRVADPEGAPVAPPIDIELEPVATLELAVDEERFVTTLFGLNGIPLASAGTYRLNLFVNEQEVRSMSLPVLVSPPRSASAESTDPD